MAVTDGHGLPIAVRIESASPHEITLLEDTLDDAFVAELPATLIGDKAYDSDKHDARLLVERGVRLVAPTIGRKHAKRKPEDGRRLRRYRRRWRVERLFAWLQNFRRIVTRWERYSTNFLGFVQLACAVILLRRL